MHQRVNHHLPLIAFSLTIPFWIQKVIQRFVIVKAFAGQLTPPVEVAGKGFPVQTMQDLVCNYKLLCELLNSDQMVCR